MSKSAQKRAKKAEGAGELTLVESPEDDIDEDEEQLGVAVSSGSAPQTESQFLDDLLGINLSDINAASFAYAGFNIEEIRAESMRLLSPKKISILITVFLLRGNKFTKAMSKMPGTGAAALQSIISECPSLVTKATSTEPLTLARLAAAWPSITCRLSFQLGGATICNKVGSALPPKFRWPGSTCCMTEAEYAAYRAEAIKTSVAMSKLVGAPRSDDEGEYVKLTRNSYGAYSARELAIIKKL